MCTAAVVLARVARGRDRLYTPTSEESVQSRPVLATASTFMRIRCYVVAVSNAHIDW